MENSTRESNAKASPVPEGRDMEMDIWLLAFTAHEERRHDLLVTSEEGREGGREGGRERGREWGERNEREREKKKK